MKKLIIFLLVSVMSIGLTGCYIGKDVSTEPQVSLSGMTQFTSKDEYSIYYKEGWTPMLTNTLYLTKGNSTFFIGDRDITKKPVFKSKISDDQLEHFYKRMLEYVEFVETTPVEGVTYESLDFSRNNVYSANENCIAVAPFKTSDGRIVVYLVTFDRKTNLLARSCYTTDNESTYIAEINEIRTMVETLRMINVTQGKVLIPNFNNIQGATIEFVANIFGEPLRTSQNYFTKKDGNKIHMIHCEYENVNFTFADGILGGIYISPGSTIFSNLSAITDQEVKQVLLKYGIIINHEVAVMQSLEKQADGRFLNTTKLVGYLNEIDGVTEKIKCIQLQENAFRVVYNEELFDLMFDVAKEEGILQTEYIRTK